MNKANQKARTTIRKMLRDTFGTANLAEIRKTLRDQAPNEYGCYHIRVQIGPGAEIMYTSNPNHFCRYGITVQGVGMSSTEALTAKDYTRAGLRRVPVSSQRSIF